MKASSFDHGVVSALACRLPLLPTSQVSSGLAIAVVATMPGFDSAWTLIWHVLSWVCLFVLGVSKMPVLAAGQPAVVLGMAPDQRVFAGVWCAFRISSASQL